MKKTLYILMSLAFIVVIACIVKYKTKRNKISFKTVSLVKNDENNLNKIRVIKNNKWGLVDKDGNIIGDLKYDFIDTFSEGIAIVKQGAKSGYVDEEFNFITPIKYDFVNRFINGYAIVNVNNKSGVINKNGEELIKPIKYDYISSISNEGHAIAKIYSENKKYIINLKDEIIKDVSSKN